MPCTEHVTDTGKRATLSLCGKRAGLPITPVELGEVRVAGRTWTEKPSYQPSRCATARCGRERGRNRRAVHRQPRGRARRRTAPRPRWFRTRTGRCRRSSRARSGARTRRCANPARPTTTPSRRSSCTTRARRTTSPTSRSCCAHARQRDRRANTSISRTTGSSIPAGTSTKGDGRRTIPAVHRTSVSSTARTCRARTRSTTTSTRSASRCLERTTS